MSDTVEPGESAEKPDRRSVLKKAGVIGVGMWAAPVVTSITSPAFAQGSAEPPPPPGGGPCLVLPRAASASVVVNTVIACNTLNFGLQSPNNQPVCTGCSGGESANLGSFAAGTELVFYLQDTADCCGCATTYTCRDTKNSRVTKVNDSTYLVEFRDNGCACGTSDISEGSNLTATVTLS